jgi:GNAT superfamily N-acetyltransferase
MNTDFRHLETETEWRQAFPLLHQLRPKLTMESYLQLVQEARSENRYKILAAYENGEIAGYMGYRFLTDFVHGRQLYIDDLVVDQSKRRSGLGARLLKWAEAEGQRLGCRTLRLCTGVDMEDAKRFYTREGWRLLAVAFKKPVP